MSSVRKLFRVVHILTGIWIAIFVFSPLRMDPVATLFAQISVIGLTISGTAMWQLPRLARVFRG